MADTWLWLGDAADARRKRRARLFDIKTDEASIVDRAANQRRFLVVKQEDGMKTKPDQANATQAATAIDDDGFDGPPDIINVAKGETIEFGTDPKDVQDPAKAEATIPLGVKDAVVKALREGVERLMQVAHALRGSKAAEAKSDRPLPPIFKAEFQAIGAVLDGVLASFPSPVTKRNPADLPTGFVWDAVKLKAVRSGTETKISAAEKASATKAIDTVIADLSALRKQVDAGVTTSGSVDSHLPEAVSRALRAAATTLGGLSSRYPCVAHKAFGLVELEPSISELQKACDGLALHPDQSKDLVEKVEKLVDDLAILMTEVDVLKERGDEANDPQPMPSKVAEPMQVAKADVLDLLQYVAEPAAKPPCAPCVNPVRKAEGDPTAPPAAPAAPGAAPTADDKAEWDTAYMNDLPDSAFLFVEEGGQKDAEGKTTPRSKRHFPVKDKAGKVDLPHVRNAIARIPQSNAPGLSDEKKKALQDQARQMLSGAPGGDKGVAGQAPPATPPPADADKTKGQECPPGQTWNATAMRCMPMDEAAQKASAPAAPAPTAAPAAAAPAAPAPDFERIITQAIGKALDEHAKRVDAKLDDLTLKLHAQGETVRKMAEQTPESNAIPAGSRAPVQKQDRPDNWKRQLNMSDEKVKELEAADLLF